jgi:ubiquinone/menaquinone biosynthesis C-methylase UbiE
VIAQAASAAERMNRIYGTQRFFYDLTRRPYLLGRAALISNLEPPAGGHVLEIGCGTAWNLIRAAEQNPKARFYGLDVSSAMPGDGEAVHRARESRATHRRGAGRRHQLRARGAVQSRHL